ncbi:MAG: putative extracellular nuclease, partial [Patiriisocius sp.]
MKYTKILPLLLACGLGAHAQADVFISEYIEGSSNNKAIEIYNSGTDSVSLEGYVLEIYFNGAATASGNVSLSGNLAGGSTYVIGHSSAGADIINVASITTVIGFNGDDTVMLRNELGDLLDVVGQFNFDPGSRWSGNGVSTQNATIVRNTNIETGDTNANDAFDPSIEWTAFPIDTFDGLGAHTTDNSGPVEPPVEPPVDPPGNGDLVAPCFNCPDLSQVADPSNFDADILYADINTAIASLPT